MWATNELVDRYLAIVKQKLPRKEREDLINELEVNISDTILSYTDEGMTEVEATRQTLNELGDPNCLVEK